MNLLLLKFCSLTIFYRCCLLLFTTLVMMGSIYLVMLHSKLAELKKLEKVSFYKNKKVATLKNELLKHDKINKLLEQTILKKRTSLPNTSTPLSFSQFPFESLKKAQLTLHSIKENYLEMKEEPSTKNIEMTISGSYQNILSWIGGKNGSLIHIKKIALERFKNGTIKADISIEIF